MIGILITVLIFVLVVGGGIILLAKGGMKIAEKPISIKISGHDVTIEATPLCSVTYEGLCIFGDPKKQSNSPMFLNKTENGKIIRIARGHATIKGRVINLTIITNNRIYKTSFDSLR